MTNEFNLVPCDDRRPDTNGVCVASIVVRNQALNLPFLLDYHRRLGIKQFFIIDNMSTDGTLEYARAQPDCFTLIAKAPFKTSHGGSLWIQEAIDRYGHGRWWLVVDADELFTYPHAETVNIEQLCGHLDRTGSEGVFASMVDMYSKCPIAEAYYKVGESFLDLCPFFDRGYKMRSRFSWLPGKSAFPPMEPIGGPRLRMFYPEFAGKSAAYYLAAKTKRALRDKINKLGFSLRFDCAVPPLLFKIPLTKTSAPHRMLGSHKTTPLKLADMTGALLHFKFFSDFHEKAALEAERRQHFDGASEYRRYLNIMRDNPALSLYTAESVRYEGSATLIKQGLMQSSDAFDLYLHTLGQTA